MNRNFKILFKILIFVFSVIILDRVIGFYLQKYYITQTSGKNYELTYILKDCKAEIFIFGNSRAKHHYDSRLIKDSLNMSCYNAGLDGAQSILTSYAQVKVITKRYPPKIIILEYNADINVGSISYDRLSVLLPYFEVFPELRPIILLRSPYENIKLTSSIYPYNSLILNIIRYNLDYDEPRNQSYEGYVPLKNVIQNEKYFEKEEEIERKKNLEIRIDTNMMNALKNIIQLCQEKNIQLYIINSPIFHKVKEKKISYSISEKIAVDYINQSKVKYFDYSFDSTFSGKCELFNDRIHLNENGAKTFTNMIIKILKKN